MVSVYLIIIIRTWLRVSCKARKHNSTAFFFLSFSVGESRDTSISVDVLIPQGVYPTRICIARGNGACIHSDICSWLSFRWHPFFTRHLFYAKFNKEQFLSKRFFSKMCFKRGTRENTILWVLRAPLGGEAPPVSLWTFCTFITRSLRRHLAQKSVPAIFAI